MGQSVSMERDRAFGQNNLCELLEQGTSTVQKAKDISTDLENVIRNLKSIEGDIMPEAKDGSFSAILGTLDGNLMKESYDDALMELKDSIAKLTLDLPTYDETFAEQMRGLADSLKSIHMRAIDLQGLLTADSIDMSYDEFCAALKDCRDKWETSTEDLQETLNEIEGNMKGISALAAVYSKDPVNLSTGNFVYDHTDLKIGGSVPLLFRRYYNAKESRKGSLGRCWRHNYEVCLQEKENGKILIIMEDGKEKNFVPEKGGSYRGLQESTDLLQKVVKTETDGADVLADTEKKETVYILRRPNGYTYQFCGTGRCIREEDRNGNGLDLFYESHQQTERLTEVKADNGSGIFFVYGENGMLSEISDHTGRKVMFEIKERKLRSVTTPAGSCYRYVYGKNGRMTEVTNRGGVRSVANTYDDSRRIIKQDFPDGGSMYYEYDRENELTLTERNGSRKTYVHDDKLRITEIRYEDGTIEKFVYNEKNRKIKETDRRGNTTHYAYDSRGNVTQIINALGEKTSFTYNGNSCLLSITANGRERLKNIYDAKGNLIKTTGALGETGKMSYNEKGFPIEVENPDGCRTFLTYDTRGNILSVKKDSGTEIRYVYDDLNRITESIDGNGSRTAYKYDTADRIVEVTDALGNHCIYEYNVNGKVTKITDFDNHTVSASYNCLNKPETITDKEGNVTSFTYDKMWNIKSQTTADGGMTGYAYDDMEHLTGVTLPEGGCFSFEYDVNGNRTAVVDAEGSRTEYVYDALNRIVEITDAEGAKTSYGYDRDGNISCIKDALGNKRYFSYDANGRCIISMDVFGNETGYSYDASGNVIEVRYPNGGKASYQYAYGRLKKKTDISGAETFYEYDANGNVTKVTNSLGETISYTYDALNRMTSVTSPNGGIRTCEYDAMGNVTKMTDENGNETVYAYSPNGNLILVLDSMGNETKYTYDCMNHLVKVERIGGGKEGKEEAWHPLSEDEEITCTQITSYEWNLSGNVSRIIDPLGDVETYGYDKNGHLIAKTDKDGYTTTFGYNRTGDVTAILYADGRSVALSYNPLRQLEEMKDWLGTTKIELDAAGRPLFVTDAAGSKVGYCWNSMGEKTKLIYPDGREASYTYNAAGQLISLQGMGEKDAVTYGYDEMGRLASKNLPNGIHTLYTYNSIGRLESLTHTGKDGMIEAYRYAYDLTGNKIRIEKERTDRTEDSGTFSYQYDALNRLTGVIKDETLLRSYRYDAFGNRTGKTDYSREKQIQTVYHYNAKNQLTSEKCIGADVLLPEKNYHYDRRGNLSQVTAGKDLLQKYTFDAANHMSGALSYTDGLLKKAEYQYNGLGQRVTQDIYQTRNPISLLGQKSSGLDQINSSLDRIQAEPMQKIRYTLDLTRQYHNLLQLTDEIQKKDQSFIWDENVAEMSEQGHESYYLQDDLGSVQNLTDKNGRSRESYEYDEFGLPTGAYHPVQPFGFTGYQMDETTGLYFAQARQYDAGSGRFVSEDIVRGVVELPFTLNPYGYCWNRPIDLVDLNGMWPQWAKTAVKITAAVAITAAVIVAAPVVAGAVATAAAAAGATTAVAAGIATVTTATAAGAVISGGVSFTNQAVDNGIQNVDMKKVGLDTASGAIKAGTLATICVTGGSTGFLTKLVVNESVDIGAKYAEGEIYGTEVTTSDIAETAAETAFSTFLFHIGDSALAGVRNSIYNQLSYKQNAWDAKVWTFARNLFSPKTGTSAMYNAFKDLGNAPKDFYEYQLMEVLRKYYVQTALSKEKNNILSVLGLSPNNLFEALEIWIAEKRSQENSEEADVTEGCTVSE